MPRLLPALVVLQGAAADARRQLAQNDLHYGLEGFNRRYATRAPTLFSGEEHFHRRLFEHESSIPEGRLQSFLATLNPGVVPDQNFRQELEQLATVTIDRVVDGDLLMHGTREHADSLRAQPSIHKVVPLVPELKLTPHFEALLPKSGSVSLNLRMTAFARHEHLRPASEELAPRYTEVLRRLCETEEWRARPSCGRLPHVEAHSDRLLVVAKLSVSDAFAVAEAMAAQPEVLWVEPHPEFRVMNAEALMITQSGSTTLDGTGTVTGTTPIWDMGIHGEGEIIGCGDSGLDTGHCFFEEATGGTATGQTYGPDHRKVVAYRPYADNEATGTRDHGTHVVGSILGESSTPGATGEGEKGVAYAAKVSFTDIGPGDAPGLAVPNDLANNYFNVDYDNGARIHTNSWGASVNAYTTSAVGVDEAMVKYDDLVILFAAGNDGGSGPGTIGSPATCKNCVTVGATENPNSGAGRNDGNLAVFSSLGPGVSNRLKPDVVAPGFFVSSANSNSAGDCPITEMAGTSMATPVTAGDTALIRQYLREGFYPSGQRGEANGDGTFQGGMIPSGAMMKALLVSSGQAMSGSFNSQPLQGNPDCTGTGSPNCQTTPNNLQGFGRVQLNKVLFASDGLSAGDRILLVDEKTGLGNNQEASFDIALRDTDTDFGGAFKAVLTWSDPPGEPISQNPIVNNLDLTVEVGGQTLRGNGGANADLINTVEMVEVPNAIGQGPIKVTVKGTAVTEGPQKFALVVTGPLNIVSPPPAPNPPPPPKPPRAPPTPLADQVALGVSIPLLVVGLVAAFGFVFKRVKGGGGGGATAVSLKPLPAGWKMLTDPSSGSPFYVNESTGARQWEPPPATAVSTTNDLPPGWRAQTDPNSGQTFYINEKTQTSQWDKPKGAAAPVSALAASAAPKTDVLPAGWSTGVDPASGRTYWFNATTKESQWTAPS